MIFTQLQSISKESAFKLLMESAFGCKAIDGLSAQFISAHPFGLELPTRGDTELLLRCIVYVGKPGGTNSSVKSLVRLVGQRIGEFGQFSHDVHFLRIISCGDDDGHDVYYEIAIADTLFIAGGCTDCSGTGGNGKETLDGVFELLSDVYEVPIDRVDIPLRGTDGQIYVSGFLERNTIPKEIYSAVKGQFTFAQGQSVRFSDFARENRPHGLQENDVAMRNVYTVAGIEDILYECSCGLGMDVPDILHAERCGIRLQPNMMHHQMVHVSVGGTIRRLSGVYFIPK